MKYVKETFKGVIYNLVRPGNVGSWRHGERVRGVAVREYAHCLAPVTNQGLVEWHGSEWGVKKAGGSGRRCDSGGASWRKER